MYDAELPGIGRHPVVIVTREAAIPVKSRVTVALVTSTVRGHPAEVEAGPQEGLARECVINCDELLTVPKAVLGRRRGMLGPEKTRLLDDALRLALGLDEW